MSTTEAIRAQLEVVRATVHCLFDAHGRQDDAETRALCFDVLHALEEIEQLADKCKDEEGEAANG
jgi:hypothetical protein